MSAYNQIEVTNDGLFLQINNTNINSERVENYSFLQMTDIMCLPLDDSAVNAYSPGTNEFDDKLEIRLTVVDNPNDIVIDIQNVTNQVTWTHNLAGLAIACADIKAWWQTAVDDAGGGGAIDAGLHHNNDIWQGRRWGNIEVTGDALTAADLDECVEGDTSSGQVAFVASAAGKFLIFDFRGLLRTVAGFEINSAATVPTKFGLCKWEASNDGFTSDIRTIDHRCLVQSNQRISLDNPVSAKAIRMTFLSGRSVATTAWWNINFWGTVDDGITVTNPTLFNYNNAPMIKPYTLGWGGHRRALMTIDVESLDLTTSSLNGGHLAYTDHAMGNATYPQGAGTIVSQSVTGLDIFINFDPQNLNIKQAIISTQMASASGVFGSWKFWYWNGSIYVKLSDTVYNIIGTLNNQLNANYIQTDFENLVYATKWKLEGVAGNNITNTNMGQFCFGLATQDVCFGINGGMQHNIDFATYGGGDRTVATGDGAVIVTSEVTTSGGAIANVVDGIEIGATKPDVTAGQALTNENLIEVELDQARSLACFVLLSNDDNKSWKDSTNVLANDSRWCIVYSDDGAAWSVADTADEGLGLNEFRFILNGTHPPVVGNHGTHVHWGLRCKDGYTQLQELSGLTIGIYS